TVRAALREIIVGDVGIDRASAHAEQCRKPRHAAPDFAEADDAQAEVAELVSLGAVVAMPPSVYQFARIRRHGEREGDHESDHQLGDRIGVRSGKIEDGDAALARGGVIDVVGAAGPLGDQLQARRALDDPASDAIERSGHEDFALSHGRCQLLLGSHRAVQDLETAVGRGTLEERAVDIRGDEHLPAHAFSLNSGRLRSLRKHRVALIALVVYHFVFFFPTLFMHRVVSPNDVFFRYAPWSEVRQVDSQNSLLNDPPTSYFTLLALVKHDWRAFHWNPFIASGIPGFGSAASASLTPFALLPALLLPLSWVYTGIILLKLNAAFFFTYLWLREERLGKGAAAVGA